MKKGEKRMKKTIFAALAASFVFGIGLAAFGARADIVPWTVPARRTLFVSAWNTRIRLQAPQNMCFVDKTMAAQNQDWINMKDFAEQNNDQVLLAGFMDCGQIDGVASWGEKTPDYGIVTWLDPAIGATTKMSREDYLDMREASFRNYAQTRFPGLKAENVHRTADAVAVILTGNLMKPGDDPGVKHQAAAIIATTTLRHVPVEFTLYYGGKNVPDKEALANIADTFARQMILLNH